MDATKTKATKSADATSGPLKVFRIDDVSVSVFGRDRNVAGSILTFYSASFSRSYKDQEGGRKYTKNFDEEDLGKVMALAKQASEYMKGARAEQVA